MEQTNSSQSQVLVVKEEIKTDVDAEAAQIADRDVKAIASVTEGGQNLSKACKLQSESELTVDSTDIHVVAASEDCMDASHSEVSAKEVDDGANNQVKPPSESREADAEICKSEQEEIEIYDTKDEVNSNHESQHLSNEEDQSLNVITESKLIKEDKETTGSLENDCNIIRDVNQSDIIDKQDVALDESRLCEHQGQTHDSYESVEETIKEIHNEGNQNNSIVTNSELTKLVQEDTEVVVVVETLPVATDSTDNFIVTLEEKDANKECSQENVTLREKQIVESDHSNNEIDLIDYSQESDDTIIEVTEVIDAPFAEQHKEQNNTDYVDSTKCDPKSVQLIDGKIAIDESINDENTEAKATDSKTLISSGKKDKEDITIIIDEKIIITEIESTDLPQIENIHKDTIKEMTERKQDDTPACKIPAVDSSMKKRSVIQDIFDDWGVENTDEDVQSTSKVHDSVEIELKSLLDETKTDQTVSSESVVTSQEKVPSANEEYDETHDIVSTTEKNKTKQSMENQKKNKARSKDAMSLNKNEKNSPVSSASRSSRSMDTRAVNATSHDTAVPKSRSRHLTSQIASPAEVTEVLKERFREKQKNVDAPRGPDIFFVKKLTQRLSSKLAGGPVNPAPKLIPLPQQTASSNPAPSSVTAQSAPANCDKKTTAENTTTEASKDGNSDNKELLAILEGDIDPDWSILKPPVLTEESKTPLTVEHSEQSNPPKLDPLVERELALKQLLELPITPSKKIPSRKKKTFRAAPSRASKDATIDAKTPLATQPKEVNIDLASENAQPNTKSVGTNLYSSSREKSGQKNQEGIRIEESRSGRKRKPTEKAREHEQTIKRQKVYRGKVPISKKQMEDKPVSSDSSIENHIAASDATNVDAVNNEKTVAKEVASKQSEDKVDPVLNKVEDSPLKRSKPSLARKGPMTKRKMVVKRLLREKMPIDKKSVQLKTKLNSPSKKTPPKAVSKPPKRIVEGPSGDVKPKKKNINEIDRLLQDEGVVNLLYDVEQPDRKRLVPITKSRAKVMDLQKVQRELKIRKKLVRNAVLRLRTPTVASDKKVSPRSKRTAIHSSDVQDKKMVEVTSPKTPTSPTEFILPAKIRNAADASIIIRRHSSSSFSSASGSPRVSIDSSEKFVEAVKSDDGTIHSLRSAKKRRDSQEEKINIAKKKKKTVQKYDIDVTSTSTSSTAATTTTAANNAIANNAEEKITVVARPGKKSEIKKVDKIGKQQENIPAIEDNVSSKVTTRSSNGAVTGKVTAKSKKEKQGMKSKVTFAKANDLNNTDDSLKDELSACLAEAATALSIVNARNVATTRKSKGKVNTSTMKTLDADNNKTKTEMQGQFSNKEINVRRHGNLVQLILTPSSSTKIRNALTLQVMQEFREALSILKRDDECRVVLLTSTGTSFCEGLDLSTLLHTNKEERRSTAQELAHAVKDFIKSLATFNKPIVAGVQGAAVGLGVTMLPLFDLVIASDKATFCTPYGKLGQIAEGAAVFTLSHILGSAITSELLLGGRTLTASEALRAGLVTRVLWPDRFQVELLPSLRAMSDQSSQSMEATKALLRHSLRKKLDAALESETYLLIQHWCSAECQTAIKAYIDGKIQ
ncbi:proteoglycan 4-like isoform X1 [Temnothorax curvispinosus]|uniref:Proteoglycan 4-like isoform X1 n=1 Tax=Temnothorax curvispinosus TaxID=300111 RepID=A0A6J1QUY3_9HYME|nr:proteoglycan 4-like isoform X1 [Temnothorax curvispinosus]